jgi:hypothetical protein
MKITPYLEKIFAGIDAELSGGKILARVIALEQAIEKLAGKTIEQILKDPPPPAPSPSTPAAPSMPAAPAPIVPHAPAPPAVPAPILVPVGPTPAAAAAASGMSAAILEEAGKGIEEALKKDPILPPAAHAATPAPGIPAAGTQFVPVLVPGPEPVKAVNPS